MQRRPGSELFTGSQHYSPAPLIVAVRCRYFWRANMLITHSYLGVSRGEHRCLFFLLLEDYIQEQTQFFRELALYLEKFARDLGGEGGIVRPFSGDIDQARRDVLEKNWTEQEAEEIGKTPGLLMINADKFDS